MEEEHALNPDFALQEIEIGMKATVFMLQAGLLKILDFLSTQVKFPVKYREFATNFKGERWQVTSLNNILHRACFKEKQKICSIKLYSLF